MALDECFYCGGPLPKAACGLDRQENKDYTWDAVLPCCGKQPKAEGQRGCNEIKAGEFAPIIFFAHRWYQKFGKMPTEQDFINKLLKFRTERDRTYEILCSLKLEDIKKLRRDISVKKFLASLA